MDGAVGFKSGEGLRGNGVAGLFRVVSYDISLVSIFLAI
jgi:hypothetical protein